MLLVPVDNASVATGGYPLSSLCEYFPQTPRARPNARRLSYAANLNRILHAVPARYILLY